MIATGSVAWPISAAADITRARSRAITAVLLAAVQVISPYVLPTLGMVCLVAAGFSLAMWLGFVVMGVSCFSLRWLIEVGERAEASSS